MTWRGDTAEVAAQLQDMVNGDTYVRIERFGNGFEVTVCDVWTQDHSHHRGGSIVEAVKMAHRAAMERGRK
jgi:hypothetical protein